MKRTDITPGTDYFVSSFRDWHKYGSSGTHVRVVAVPGHPAGTLYRPVPRPYPALDADAPFVVTVDGVELRGWVKPCDPPARGHDVGFLTAKLNEAGRPIAGSRLTITAARSIVATSADARAAITEHYDQARAAAQARARAEDQDNAERCDLQTRATQLLGRAVDLPRWDPRPDGTRVSIARADLDDLLNLLAKPDPHQAFTAAHARQSGE